MTNQMTKEVENVRLLLFTHLGIPTINAKQYLDALEEKPEKVTALLNMLTESFKKQYDTIKAKPLEEINRMAKERVEEWKNTIGPVTIKEFVTMSKQWNVPVYALLDRKLTPEIIKQMLDCFVIGQEKYKIMLSVAFYSYFMTSKNADVYLPKSNLLVCGPSGSGKTYGMQVLSRLFKVPFIIIHCNSLVQEGIVGTTIADGFSSFASKGRTKEEIEHAVVCFDEFDKLFEKNNNSESAGVYNERIINEMLNIIDDDGEVDIKIREGLGEWKKDKLKTTKMMFVFTGVFNGLRKEDEYSRKPIGFITHEKPVEEMPEINENKYSMDNLIEYGVKPEIVGRIRNVVFLDALTEEDMVALFDLGINSPFNEFGEYFAQNGIHAILTDEGKHTLAKLACKYNLGVRGLKSLIQQILLEDMYDLEVGPENILRITRQYIMDNLKK